MGHFGPIFDPFFDHIFTWTLKKLTKNHWVDRKSVIFGDLVFEKNEKKFHEKITNFGFFEKWFFHDFIFVLKWWFLTISKSGGIFLGSFQKSWKNVKKMIKKGSKMDPFWAKNVTFGTTFWPLFLPKSGPNFPVFWTPKIGTYRKQGQI